MPKQQNKTVLFFDVKSKPRGIKRLILATKNSARALTWLFKNESAFRQECVALFAAIPVSFALNITLSEQIILIGSVLFVMLCEIVNTAIEVVIDRISLEIHPLSGLAKDLGSAVVSISLILALLVWLVVCL